MFIFGVRLFSYNSKYVSPSFVNAAAQKSINIDMQAGIQTKYLITWRVSNGKILHLDKTKF